MNVGSTHGFSKPIQVKTWVMNGTKKRGELARGSVQVSKHIWAEIAAPGVVSL